MATEPLGSQQGLGRSHRISLRISKCPAGEDEPEVSHGAVSPATSGWRLHGGLGMLPRECVGLPRACSRAPTGSGQAPASGMCASGRQGGRKGPQHEGVCGGVSLASRNCPLGRDTLASASQRSLWLSEVQECSPRWA